LLRVKAALAGAASLDGVAWHPPPGAGGRGAAFRRRSAVARCDDPWRVQHCRRSSLPPWTISPRLLITSSRLGYSDLISCWLNIWLRPRNRWSRSILSVRVSPFPPRRGAKKICPTEHRFACRRRGPRLSGRKPSPPRRASGQDWTGRSRQPGDSAGDGVGRDRISLRRTPMRHKLTPSGPEIRGMST